MKTRIWYTADGRDIQLRQMSALHINRCIRSIRFRASVLGQRWRWRYIDPLHAELARRGEPVTNPVTEADLSRSLLRYRSPRPPPQEWFANPYPPTL